MGKFSTLSEIVFLYTDLVKFTNKPMWKTDDTKSLEWFLYAVQNVRN